MRIHRYLLSASRDRTFCVFSVPDGASRAGQSAAGASGTAPPQPTLPPAGGATDGGAAGGGFRLLKRVRGAHGRIIWGACWSPNDALIATCSRDHTVKLWRMAENGPAEPAAGGLPAFGCAVTAVAFAPLCSGSGSSGESSCVYHLGVGLEDGNLQVWRVDVSADSGAVDARLAWRSDAAVQHAAAVRRLAWRALVGERGGSCWQLATVGEDHQVKVLHLRTSASD